MNGVSSDTEIDRAIKGLKNDLKDSSRPFREIFRNRFSGAHALVISAGPSAKYWRELYDVLPKPVLLVCVKQAIELEGVSELCNVHFCNSWNLKNYIYDRLRVLRIFSSAPGDPPSLQSWDVRYEIQRGVGGLETSLAASKAFADWTMDRRGHERPWGPGIMYETVLYTLVHMGIASISTIGWDIADGGGTNSHFYDHERTASKKHSRARPDRRIRRLLLATGGGYVRRIWQYKTGRKYNVCGMLAGEAELVSASLPALNQWLESNRVTLNCYTNSLWFPSFLANDPKAALRQSE